MKILLICFILMYQCQSIKCQILKKIFTNVKSFGSLVGAVFRGLADRMHRTMVPSSPPGRGQHNIKPMTFIPGISPSLNEPEPQHYKHLKKHPTALLPTDWLISYHGRLPETHYVMTPDGYILTLHRVVPPKLPAKKTVLLHHGLMGSSADWVMLGDTSSLPYILSDAGYDVWMTNVRGNYYSQLNTKLDANSDLFWDFSWQEMGVYDLPAVINYIRETKHDRTKIDFIGHSMGASALLVMLSTSKVYNDYIRIGILLAPLVYMKETRGPLVKVINTTAANPGEYVPRRKMPLKITKKFCKRHRLYCNNPLFFITGGLHPTSPLNRDRDFLATLMSHVPFGVSMKTMVHYARIAWSGKFHSFNDVNAEYPLKDVKVPLVLFSSTEDRFCSFVGVRRLFNNIGNPVEHVMLNRKNITHTEFVWGHQAPRYVFSKILLILTNFHRNEHRVSIRF